ncbi:chaperone protein dnaJ 11, chloroplastic-like [Primulina eburnea]|uniref:chaperone protein dnaJ 11, chloroplastic-like n=1 Tax=Primulina eburnea TaxID=1245227 RepID=UPI003C6CB18F
MLVTLPLSSRPTLAFHSGHPIKIFVCSAMADTPPMVTTAAVDRKSLYEVLRVKRNASQREIKTAYRTLAKLYHPDATSRFMDSSVAATSTDGGDFIEIHNAYATLSDPDARAVYDFNLNVGLRRRLSSERFYRSRRWETDQCW